MNQEPKSKLSHFSSAKVKKKSAGLADMTQESKGYIWSHQAAAGAQAEDLSSLKGTKCFVR